MEPNVSGLGGGPSVRSRRFEQPLDSDRQVADADASGVEAQIAAGSLACPGQSIADAQALVSRARALRANLMALTGVLGPNATVAALPHAAPTASSP